MAITFRACAAANVKLALYCRACASVSSFGLGLHAADRHADKDLMAAWSAGKLCCPRHHAPFDSLTFTWSNPIGSRDLTVAEWRAGFDPVAFDLPDPQRGPAWRQAGG